MNQSLFLCVQFFETFCRNIPASFLSSSISYSLFSQHNCRGVGNMTIVVPPFLTYKCIFIQRIYIVRREPSLSSQPFSPNFSYIKANVLCSFCSGQESIQIAIILHNTNLFFSHPLEFRMSWLVFLFSLLHQMVCCGVLVIFL